MATKLKVNYEFVGDSTTPVTRTNSIKHGDKMLNKVIDDMSAYVTPEMFGAVGDGIADDTSALSAALNSFKRVLLKNTYKVTNLSIPSDKYIFGNGTILGNICINGSTGGNLSFSSMQSNRIIGLNDKSYPTLINVYKYTSTITENKRQTNLITNSGGGLGSELISYGSEYTVEKINAVKNVVIEYVTINGNISIDKSYNVVLNSCLVNGKCNTSYSYNIRFNYCSFNFGNEERNDVFSGSSDIHYNECIFNGGNTVSDNGALKLNEVFHSYIRNCKFYPKSVNEDYTGTYHAIFIDGDFAEEGYERNNSYDIVIDGVNIPSGLYYTSIFVSLGNKIKINNAFVSNIHAKYSDVEITNSTIAELWNEIETNLYISNCCIEKIVGTYKNITFTNCKLETVSINNGMNDFKMIGCTINNLTNSSGDHNSVKGIIISSCIVNNLCLIKGYSESVIDIITNCAVVLDACDNCRISVVVRGVTNAVNELIYFHNVRNSIFNYIISENISLPSGCIPIRFDVIESDKDTDVIVSRILRKKYNYSSGFAAGSGYIILDIDSNLSPSNVISINTFSPNIVETTGLQITPIYASGGKLYAQYYAPSEVTNATIEFIVAYSTPF